jgi:hypothetical protein
MPPMMPPMTEDSDDGDVFDCRCLFFFNTTIKSFFNVTVFDGDPRCHIDTCFLYPNEGVVFGIRKASHLSIGCFLTETLAVILTLAFCIQTKASLWE